MESIHFEIAELGDSKASLETMRLIYRDRGLVFHIFPLACRRELVLEHLFGCTKHVHVNHICLAVEQLCERVEGHAQRATLHFMAHMCPLAAPGYREAEIGRVFDDGLPSLFLGLHCTTTEYK